MGILMLFIPNYTADLGIGIDPGNVVTSVSTNGSAGPVVVGEWLESPTSVPDQRPVHEPIMMLLLGAGLIGLAGLGRRTFKNHK